MEKTYAYKNIEDILKKSSSGGAFWGIAETFFDNGGGVFVTEQNLTQNFKLYIPQHIL